jgi:hypothetical protein
MPAIDIDMTEAAWEMRHHAPKDERTATAHETARSIAFGALGLLAEIVPAGRDKSLMKTHIEDALMRANRAIATHGGPPSGADLERVARGLTAVFGDWARMGWQPDYPSDEDLDETELERLNAASRAAAEAYQTTRAAADGTHESALGVAVTAALRSLGAARSRAAAGAESAARAFHTILVELPDVGMMVPTAVNMPWDEVEGAWRNTLVRVFSELYAQGTIR